MIQEPGAQSNAAITKEQPIEKLRDRMTDPSASDKSTSEDAASPANPDTGQIDIDLLIVDDEVDFRESACRYLKRIGFRVDEAEDGEEALNVSTTRNLTLSYSIFTCRE